MRGRLSCEAYEAGVARGDRAVLARAITLVESTRADDEALGQELLTRLLPKTGGAVRLGVTGPPGVGKSTFLDALGTMLVDAGQRVAVLAVDPSSAQSGGSILGDKTRMSRLAGRPEAFVRPSPAGESLGGVARRTREALLLCEAAGFDVVLVETVGVGQSETAVAELVDCFLLLALPGAGDELQGIKKGVLELVDVVGVNKADAELRPAAERARRDLEAALHYQRPRTPEWTAPVRLLSARTGEGVDALYREVLRHRAHLVATGQLARERAAQAQRWMWTLAEEQVLRAFRESPEVRALSLAHEAAVRDQRLPPLRAARELVRAFEVGAARGPGEPGGAEGPPR
jgi:LAO/AO transport system kinase